MTNIWLSTVEAGFYVLYHNRNYYLNIPEMQQYKRKSECSFFCIFKIKVEKLEISKGARKRTAPESRDLFFYTVVNTQCFTMIVKQILLELELELEVDIILSHKRVKRSKRK